MRKKTVSYVADTIFWYLVYMLPILAYLLYMFVEPGTGATLVPFSDFMTNSGFAILPTNMIYSLLMDLFGVGGTIPVFDNAGILMFFSWFVFVYLIHVVIDIVLFIPRLAHKLMDKYTRKVGD